jgi:hypothetical protein
MNRRLAFIAAVALGGLAGCSSSEFNTPDKLNKTRILAIQADPPQPVAGASTTLRALVYRPGEVKDASISDTALAADVAVDQAGPVEISDAGTLDDGGALATQTPSVISPTAPMPAAPVPSTQGFTWSWCPLPTTSANGYACPVDQAGFDRLYAALGLGSSAPSLSLGTGDTATLINPFPAPLLKALCNRDFKDYPALRVLFGSEAGGEADAGFACTKRATVGSAENPVYTFWDYPVTVRLDVAGTPNLAAVETVYLPTDDSLAANQNPTVNGVSITLPVDAATGNLPRNVRVPLLLQMNASAAELKPYKDAAGRLFPGQPYIEIGHKKDDPPIENDYEALNISWFNEAGDFGDDHQGGSRTGYSPNLRDEFSKAVDNFWTLPKRADYEKDTAGLVVVVRDSRGGVTWTRTVATLEATP